MKIMQLIFMTALLGNVCASDPVKDPFSVECFKMKGNAIVKTEYYDRISAEYIQYAIAHRHVKDPKAIVENFTIFSRKVKQEVLKNNKNFTAQQQDRYIGELRKIGMFCHLSSDFNAYRNAPEDQKNNYLQRISRNLDEIFSLGNEVNKREFELSREYVVQNLVHIFIEMGTLDDKGDHLKAMFWGKLVQGLNYYLETDKELYRRGNAYLWGIAELVPPSVIFQTAFYVHNEAFFGHLIRGLDLKDQEIQDRAHDVLGAIALFGLKDNTYKNVVQTCNIVNRYNTFLVKSQPPQKDGFTIMLSSFLRSHLYDLAEKKDDVFISTMLDSFMLFTPEKTTETNFGTQFDSFGNVAFHLLKAMQDQQKSFFEKYEQFKPQIIQKKLDQSEKYKKKLKKVRGAKKLGKREMQRTSEEFYESNRQAYVKILTTFLEDETSDSSLVSDSSAASKEEGAGDTRQKIAQKAKQKLRTQTQLKIKDYEGKVQELKSTFGDEWLLNKDLKTLKELKENTDQHIAAFTQKESFDAVINDQFLESYEKFTKAFHDQMDAFNKALKEKLAVAPEAEMMAVPAVNFKSEVMQKIKDDQIAEKLKAEKAEELKAEKMASRSDKQEAYKQMEEKSKSSSEKSDDNLSSEEHSPDLSLNKIAGFKNKQTKNMFDSQTDPWKGKAVNLLNCINQANSIHELSQMDLGDAHLEKLQVKLVNIGNTMCETYSLRINEKYRITFIWNGQTGKAHKVWIGDYH